MFTDQTWVQEYLGEETNSQEINVFKGNVQRSHGTPKGHGEESGPRGPITPEERQRRFDRKLCFYCSKPSHKAHECGVRLYHQVWNVKSLVT